MLDSRQPSPLTTQLASQPDRRPWRAPKVLLATVASTEGGFTNPAVTAEVHFPSAFSTSNHS
jgi:hypothetical protein